MFVYLINFDSLSRRSGIYKDSALLQDKSTTCPMLLEISATTFNTPINRAFANSPAQPCTLSGCCLELPV